MLGFDPSLKKSGYVVMDLDKPVNVVEDKGLLRTEPTDGILLERLIKQTEQVRSKLKEYNIKFIGAEAPFYEAFSTEILFALNQFFHRMYMEEGIYIVYFPPQQLKKLVFPNDKVSEIKKPNMIDKAKTFLNLQGKKLPEDTADAYWAGYFGRRFKQWFIDKTLSDKDLGEYERDVFSGKHTFSRGMKKGTTEYSGIIYRENELFYDFEKIKGRVKNGELQKESKETQ
jgi:Holliday junction resolvasome RuvABC endonuclease subunit